MKTVQIPISSRTFYNADIEPGKSIRLYGDDCGTRSVPTPFDKTFKIGDWAEYASYNLTYIGQIVAIGEKTVTIRHEHGEAKSRLSLDRFAWRNWDFDLDKIRERNSNELYYI